MDTALEQALSALSGETKGIFLDLAARFDEEKKQREALQKQVDAIDAAGAQRFGTSVPTKSTATLLQENDQISQLIRDQRGKAVLSFKGEDAMRFLERKTTLTEAAQGFATTGVVPIERTPGIVAEARQRLFLRDALTARPTALPLIDFMRVLSPLVKASPQIEAANKQENAVTFTSVSEKVRTIATVLPVSKQIISDLTELSGFLDTGLRYYVRLSEEQQMLSGDGSLENLHGLITQATSFDTGLLSISSGWTKIDILARVVQQIASAKEVDPTFVVLNPVDFWSIRLIKNSLGDYIFGPPTSPAPVNIFGLMPIVSGNITSGTFLVGSGSPVAVEIRDRMELIVEISDSHLDFFARNLLMLRAEVRLALLVYRPASFITGTLNSSPAFLG